MGVEGEKQGAGVKGGPGEGRALAVERHPGSGEHEQNMWGPVGLVQQWRPGTEAASAGGSGRLKGTWWEKRHLEAPGMADGLQPSVLCAPHQGGPDVTDDLRSCPGSCSGGCGGQEAQGAARSRQGQEGQGGQAGAGIWGPWPPQPPHCPHGAPAVPHPSTVPTPVPTAAPPKSAAGCGSPGVPLQAPGGRTREGRVSFITSLDVSAGCLPPPVVAGELCSLGSGRHHRGGEGRDLGV